MPSWRPDVARQGRHRRGGRAHRRRRPRAVDAVRRAATRARKPVLTPIQMRTRKAKRALAARGLVEAVTWSFVAKRAGRAVRRRQAGAGARQSDRGRTLRHAAEPAAGPGRGGAEATPIAASPTSRCSRSGRSSGATSRRISSPPRPACAARWRKPRRRRPALVARRPSRSTPSTPRPMRFAVLAAAGAPVQALQVVPGGPAWFHPGRSRHHPDRAAERARPFRRTASARAGGARRRRARWSASR